MTLSSEKSMNRVRLLLILALFSAQTSISVSADEPVGFRVETTTVVQELNPQFCWFHPRATAIPGLGNDGLPAVIMTIQKHLITDDHYSGLWTLRSDDLGNTWKGPTEIPELAWRTEPGPVPVHLAVADVTPQWHAKSGKVIAIGIQVRYDDKGRQLSDKPRSHDFAYTVYDPKTDRWTVWRNLEGVPDAEGQYYSVAPGCVQSVIKDDGSLLVPVYVKNRDGDDYQSTVFALDFDGDKLTYKSHGDELKIQGRRGCYEPSLIFYQGRYYLTLRNDIKAYVTTSEDGHHFGPLKAWTFDDGSDLGSYNTQAHWLVHSQGLFLTYTRRGADNDHIARNRAPIFLAQVDTANLQVMRKTEQVVLPERGVMLGNFGASSITPDESWITDAEYINNGMKHPRGADGTTWVGRVKWSQPNSLVESKGPPIKLVTLGDSITRAVRQGVGPTETFTVYLGSELRARGYQAQSVNMGIGGEQTNQALVRLEKDVLSQQPTAVTIMYGTNDSYQYKGEPAPRITIDEYRANLKQLIQRIKAAGAVPILMTPPRWAKGGKNGVGDDPNIFLEKYVPVCRELAKEEKIPLVDHYQIWTEADSKGINIAEWTTDLYHPNPAGQRLMADAILPVLLKALSQTDKKPQQ